MRIARGLKQSYKNAREMNVAEVTRELENRTDCYEVLNDTLNRVYLDVDGKLPEEMTVQQFDDVRTQTMDAIASLSDNQEYALMESSKYDLRKVSFRVVFPKVKATKKNNKAFVLNLSKTLTLPDGVRIDPNPYGQNQKMRMLGQNKDGENRPLVLLRGNVEDTFISIVPEDAEVLEVPEEPKKPRGRPRKIVQNTLISDILNEVNVKRLDEYATWIETGFILFNEGLDCAVWEKASERSLKYKRGECEKKWKTFTKGSLGIARLWEWLKEDNSDAYERLKLNDYAYRKERFEITNFKLRNPPRFGRITPSGEIQFLNDHDLLHIYGGEICGESPFIKRWIHDPEMLTYEKLEFRPEQDATEGCYNLWTGFHYEAVKGDWEPIRELVWNLSGRNQEVYDYIVKWSAHIFQKPYEKPETMIIFSSETEGVGKDTYGDAVLGKILGREYYFNSKDQENEMFGRFTSHLQNKLLIKMEEMRAETCNKHDDLLKGWITGPHRTYEEKGISRPPSIDSFHRIIGTTNDPCPVKLTRTFRRYLLVNPYAGHAGDVRYWNQWYASVTPEVLQAYLYHLIHEVDLEGWNPREKVETSALMEARLSQAPPHARFFQRLSATRNSDEDCLEQHFHELREGINQIARFAYTDYKLSRELRIYPHETRVLHGRTMWKFNLKQIEDFLRSKHWWLDGV